MGLKKGVNSTLTTSDLIAGHIYCRLGKRANGVRFLKGSGVLRVLSGCPR